MPIYEYECKQCRKVMEVWQSMSDAPVSTCPDCSGEMEKLISSSSFQLKGGGWYSDGYNCASANGSGTSGEGTKAGSGCAAGGCCGC